ncbi:Oligosaccharyltransferase complex/magnesium transporter family protein [Prunus dulcis]|uniref:Oligosaccharyltransferase complex/magnesium transporter family protein n=1 Tax=Prunus dulcis TaxID=3755 RepID=A0A4Y1R960_PRUDU|nr:Oligosaccharyltransferase complex/magnesium transporter family protein [Prunus dulcis]
MGPIPKLPLVFLITTLLFLTAFIGLSESNSDQVAELLSLQARSKSGLIRLDDHSLSRFLTSVKTPRPYWVLIFFDAAKLHDKQELHLKELRSEFALVASSFIENNDDPSSSSHAKLFFCDIEFQDSQHSFAQFGVNSLPHIRLIGPNHSLKESQQMDQGDFSRLAESMSEFIESKTKLVVGPIRRPPMLSKKQIMFATIAWLIWLPFIGKKIISGKTLLHDPRIWLSGLSSFTSLASPALCITSLEKCPCSWLIEMTLQSSYFSTRAPECSLEQKASQLGSCTPLLGCCWHSSPACLLPSAM